jgi:ubiquinone/menaquinone biosynthesis C-methylase UbiE
MVLDGHRFHCLIGPARAQFLREAFRVLKPAGVFFT